jgi:hypothetical protein
MPDDVVCLMKLPCVGTPDPEFDADPKIARSDTLQFYKEAILFFIPNLLISWNVTRMEGTNSLEFNAFIKMVEQRGKKKMQFQWQEGLDRKGFRMLHQV